MKKPTKIGNIVLEYLNRNTKYDEIPDGYYSRKQILEVTGYSQRQFYKFVAKARVNKMAEYKWFKIANGARVSRSTFYKFNPALVKLMGLASR
jgi:hypothetical protein